MIENNTSLVKTCSKCGIEKYFSLFYKEKRSTSGLTSACKKCILDQQKEKYSSSSEIILARNKKYRDENREKVLKSKIEYYQRNRDKILLEQKEYREKNPEVIRNRGKIYREKNQEIIRAKKKEYSKTENGKLNSIESSKRARLKFPEKERARGCVNRAVKTGKLHKPNNCQRCGCDNYLEAHHNSYEKEFWLDVEWLCEVCHTKEHLEKVRARGAQAVADAVKLAYY